MEVTALGGSQGTGLPCHLLDFLDQQLVPSWLCIGLPRVSQSNKSFDSPV